MHAHRLTFSGQTVINIIRVTPYKGYRVELIRNANQGIDPGYRILSQQILCE